MSKLPTAGVRLNTREVFTRDTQRVGSAKICKGVLRFPALEFIAFRVRLLL